MEKKKALGQYFTVNNPFHLSVFKEWFCLIPDDDKKIIVEPFAGANNIVKMVNEFLDENNYRETKWCCYDIDTSHVSIVPGCKIENRDTLKSFPQGFSVAITNPPYLAKNSATRSKLDFPDTDYDDLYKYCLSVLLRNLDYVAAIIPESFITCDLFRERLYAVSSLTCNMFVDTECPVCLSLFVPEKTKVENSLEITDYKIYQMDTYIGNSLSILQESSLILSPSDSDNSVIWKFNDKSGNIGIKCIDNTKNPSIYFLCGDMVDSKKVSSSSRSLTLVSGLPSDVDLELFVDDCNKLLNMYRQTTHDIYLTSFKGLRADGKYRRRLDFNTARKILNSVYNRYL